MEQTQPAADPDIRGFWTWFADHQAEVLEIIRGTKTGRVTEMIDQALAATHLHHLTYEITGGALGAELTFTPQGDPLLGYFIDRFVSAAPSFESWMIFARVQRKSLAAALKFVKALHGVDISEAKLKSVELDDRYHLCFLHDELFKMAEERRYSIAMTFLDHALGEQTVMDWIGQIEFKKAGEGIAMGLLINEIIVETSEEPITSLRPAG